MKGFKVLLEIENEDNTVSLVSSFHDISDKLQIKYQLGMNKPRREGTKIYFFDTLENAISYCKVSILKCHIIECQVKDAVQTSALLEIGTIGQDLYSPAKYEKDFARLTKELKKKTPKIEGCNLPAPGTYETDALELLGRVNQ